MCDGSSDVSFLTHDRIADSVQLGWRECVEDRTGRKARPRYLVADVCRGITAEHAWRVRQLPRHLSRVFMQGCGDAHNNRAPIRLEGEVPREDGKTELYRAAFIPVGVKENSLTHLAFGAFNSRVAPAMAA